MLKKFAHLNEDPKIAAPGNGFSFGQLQRNDRIEFSDSI